MNKVIKGQAWISGSSLIQEQITIAPGKQPTTETVTLVEDIWKDLTGDGGTYKSNPKKTYFYWEVEQSSLDDGSPVKTMIECPSPKDGLFVPPFTQTVTGDWSKYWIGKFKTSYDNFQSRSTIQPKEVVFPGTEYVNPQGDIVKVQERRDSCTTDLGDITNLLGMF